MPTTDELREANDSAESWMLTVAHETDIPGSVAGVRLTFPDMGVDDIAVTVRIATDGEVEVWVEGTPDATFHEGAPDTPPARP